MSNFSSLPPSSPPPGYPPSIQQEELWKASVRELEIRKCAARPWYFISRYLKTNDAHDLANPFKSFPDYHYLKYLVDLLRTEWVLTIEKSRQVMVTWIICAFNLWDAQFHGARLIFYQSETQDKANAMLARTWDLYESQPQWMKDRHPAKKTDDKLRMTNRSEIWAIPQGPAILAGYTASRIWSDETAKQKYCDKSYKAGQPTLKGAGGRRGQAVFSSTPEDTWFELLASDQLTTPNPPPPLYNYELCQGMWLRKLAISGHMVVWLHYTADPLKRSQEWYEETKRGVPDEDWLQEYEIKYGVKRGQSAFPQFAKHRSRIIIPMVAIPDWWPRWATGDYGLQNPFAVHFWTLAPDGTEICYWEFYAKQCPISRAVREISSHPDWPKLECFILDRSCWNTTQQQVNPGSDMVDHQLRSIKQLIDAEFERQGVHRVSILPAASTQDRVKVAAINEVWDPQLLDAGVAPTLQIVDTCENLVRELPGIRWKNLNYVQKLNSNLPDKLIDKDNHAFDSMCYSRLHRKYLAENPAEPTETDAEAQKRIRREMQEADHARIEEEQRMLEGAFGNEDWS